MQKSKDSAPSWQDATIQELKFWRELIDAKVKEMDERQRASKPRKRKGKVYRHPENQFERWNGLGNRPAWVREWVAAGKDLEVLRVDTNTATQTEQKGQGE